ncbi:MAG: redoxin domain-containing protein [Bacteroidetes bacterium]|nr:redoxin domain-containing protein [Bacteroidota bacterium]MDA1268927.1 redoxin domain-containing protein [Bacteroidota bacterium]
MKFIFVSFLLLIGLRFTSYSQNYNQLAATDAVSNSLKTLPSLAKEKGVVLIFYDPSCPFAKLYESRIKALANKFQGQGMGFALINPQAQNSESELTRLRTYIDESGLNMPYLMDEKQQWTQLFQSSKIPEVILLIPGKSGLELAYKGALDNNAQVEGAVTEKYLEIALIQVVRGEKPAVPQVRAVGCNIRTY